MRAGFRFDKCPVLKLQVWGEEALAVAIDWALENGVEDAWTWSDTNVRDDDNNIGERWNVAYSPMLVRAALAENLDPAQVKYADRFTMGYVSAGLSALDDRAAHTAVNEGIVNWSGEAATAEDIEPVSLAHVVADCVSFERKHEKALRKQFRLELDMLRDDDVTWEHVGDLFYETRNEVYQFHNAVRLSNAARKLGPFTFHFRGTRVIGKHEAAEHRGMLELVDEEGERIERDEPEEMFAPDYDYPDYD